MTALDTSVCVPALLAEHPDHEICRRAAHRASIPSHALVESYAVLTRLPAGHRIVAPIAAELLARWFPDASVLVAPARLQRSLVRRMEAAGVSGGCAYDALVGLIAATHGEELLTRDLRAVETYRALGVTFRLLGGPTT